MHMAAALRHSAAFCGPLRRPASCRHVASPCFAASHSDGAPAPIAAWSPRAAALLAKLQSASYSLSGLQAALYMPQA